MRAAEGAIRRRLILFVHGFDPRGPGPIHALHRADVAAGEAARIGLEVGKRVSRPGETAWPLSARWPDGAVEAEFVMLRWDDLVRDRWERPLLAQLRILIRWAAIFARSGYFAETARSARAAFWAAISPPLAVLGFFLAAVLVGGLAAWGLAAVGERFGVGPWPAVLAPGLLALLPMAWRRVDAWLNLGWISRCFGYDADLAVGAAPEMETRLDAFADRLAEAVTEGWDEVLVLGHSVGSVHAVSVVGRAIERGVDMTTVRLLTTGQCLPAMMLGGGNARLTDDLGRLVAAPRPPWLDVTSASDPASTCGWRPLRFSPWEDRSDRVTRRSPRFHLALSPANFAAIRRDPMAFHFQYLRASDAPSVYDIWRLLLGPTAAP